MNRERSYSMLKMFSVAFAVMAIISLTCTTNTEAFNEAKAIQLLEQLENDLKACRTHLQAIMTNAKKKYPRYGGDLEYVSGYLRQLQRGGELSASEKKNMQSQLKVVFYDIKNNYKAINPHLEDYVKASRSARNAAAKIVKELR